MSAPTTRGGKGRPARTSKHWPDEATFLRERDVFVLRQLMLDFSLPHHAAQIGGLIALHVNFECGVAEVGYRGQRAVLVEVRPIHRRSDGEPTFLLVWRIGHRTATSGLRCNSVTWDRQEGGDA